MRILVVEDEPAVLQALTFVLESESFAVDTAANGEEALRRVEGEPPDLIILDLWMPVMNGWRFLERLRALGPPLDALPVIVVSADVKAGEARLPIQAFMPKPMDVDRLLETVRAHLP
ncbi:MAG TPA: response regulator [Gemmatimonadota bacterium]|jgi:CheY-like chemotaxis protein